MQTAAHVAPKQLVSLLIAYIKARLPVLITGSPGIGKTSIVKQVAELLGADLILDTPAVNDPTDAKGLPWIDKDGESATFKPFGNLARALKAKKLTIWFLDDLGQAPPAVQASYMQLLLARRVNGHVLPDCVVFVAATNRRTDRAGVSGILEPVKSRFGTIVELGIPLDDWCEWALTHDVLPEVIAYLRFEPDMLNQFVPSADLVNCAIPRTWERASDTLKMNLPADVEAAAVAGAIGEGAAGKLLAFIQMFRQLPNIDEILKDPDAAALPTQTSVLYAVVTALASRATAKTFPAVCRYAQRLLDAAHGEFAALLLRDAARRTPALQQTPAFAKLIVGTSLGALISGQIA